MDTRIVSIGVYQKRSSAKNTLRRKELPLDVFHIVLGREKV